MNDREFVELQLKATICPSQCKWPKSTHGHWQKLHEAANEARARVSEAYRQMDEIDRKADLSRNDKSQQRSKTAAEEIAHFEASKTLARAVQAAEFAVAKHKFEPHVSPEIARDSEATLKAIKAIERGWQKGMDKIAERAGRINGPGM